MFSNDYENGASAAMLEIEKFAADSGNREASAIAAALLGRGAIGSGLMADEGKGFKAGVGGHLGQYGGRIISNTAKKYTKGKNLPMKELRQVAKRGGAGAGAYFSHGKNAKK